MHHDTKRDQLAFHAVHCASVTVMEGLGVGGDACLYDRHVIGAANRRRERCGCALDEGAAAHSGPLLRGLLVGGGLIQRPHRVRPEQVLPLELHVGRNPTPRLPVEYPLRAAGAVAEGARELCGTAKPIDEGCVVHDALNTTFIRFVNAMYINEAFTTGTIGEMHPSYIRLMEAAKKATQGTAQAISRPADLARHMIESPQRIHNWQVRGVSKEGAIKAEGLYGVSVSYVLDGTESQAPQQFSGPPLPPPNFADRREVTDTDWGLLQDVHLVMSDQELEQLRARAERTRRIAQVQLESVAAGAAPQPPRPSERVIRDESVPAHSPRRHTK